MNVRTLCLGILSLQEATGYEIKKLVEEGFFSHFIEASFGSIYPALTQMHKEGLLTVRFEGQEGRPDKKVYAITDAGRKALRVAVNVKPMRDKFKSEFLFQMLLMDLVNPDHLAEAYDEQISDLREELSNVDKCSAEGHIETGQEFVNGYARIVLNAAIQYMLDHRSEFVSQDGGLAIVRPLTQAAE